MPSSNISKFCIHFAMVAAAYEWQPWQARHVAEGERLHQGGADVLGRCRPRPTDGPGGHVAAGSPSPTSSFTALPFAIDACFVVFLEGKGACSPLPFGVTNSGSRCGRRPWQATVACDGCGRPVETALVHFLQLVTCGWPQRVLGHTPRTNLIPGINFAAQ